MEVTFDCVDFLEVRDWQMFCPLDQNVLPGEFRCYLAVVDVDSLDMNLLACEKEPHRLAAAIGILEALSFTYHAVDDFAEFTR